MPTPDVQTASLKSTGSSTSRTFGSRFAETVNVKDFGAVGDGSTNDTSAIQAAFDAAFTTAGTPNGSANATRNRPVFFPAGKYLISSALTLTDVLGGMISGAGMRASKIITNTNSISLITTNGMKSTKFRGLNLIGTGAANGCTGITLDWDGTGVGLERNSFFDFAVDSCATGVSIAASGNAGDFNYFHNTWIDACSTGIKILGANAIFQTISGGGFTNCTTYGLWADLGSFGAMQAPTFKSNALDMRLETAYPTSLLGGVSTSTKFCEIVDGKLNLYMFSHLPGSAGDFVDLTSPASVLVDGCVINGTSTGFRGTGRLHIRNTALTTGGIGGMFTNFTGVLEKFQLPRDTFANLPATPYEGMTAMISNGSGTPAWGSTVSAGGGSSIFKLYRNASNWTLTGR